MDKMGGNVFDKRATSEGRKPNRVLKRALRKEAPKPFTDDGMFGVPDGMKGIGFDTKGIGVSNKGLMDLTSKKDTFAGLGRKEGRKLGMSGKKSIVRKVRN